MSSGRLFAVALAGLALLVSGCTLMPAQNEAFTVKGTASWRDPMPMPAGAVLLLTVRETREGGGPGPVVRETRLPAPERQLRIPFQFEVERKLLDTQRRHELVAEVQVGGAVRFRSRPTPLTVSRTLDDVGAMLLADLDAGRSASRQDTARR